MKNLRINLFSTLFILVLSLSAISNSNIESEKNLTNYVQINAVKQTLCSQEELKLILTTKDTKPNTTATMEVEIISPNGIPDLGIYNLVENDTTIINVNNNDWIINTLDKSEGAILEYWYE